MTQEELLAILGRGDFEAVVGAPEIAEIDFKQTPYRADEAAEAFELAKDVTALAHGEEGGLLVIGFKTEAHEESAIDTVVSVHPFPRAMFNRDQWLSKVDQLAYPTVVGLDVQFIASRDDRERGIAIVTIPPQARGARYFVVAKAFVPEGGAPGWLLGISVRSADRNRPLGIGEIHRLISQGLNLGTDVAEIKALLAAGAQVSRAAAPAESLLERARRARAEMEER
jgi:hypothetical protein